MDEQKIRQTLGTVFNWGLPSSGAGVSFHFFLNQQVKVGIILLNVLSKVFSPTMILAVVNQKGGTGKTCKAVHIAYWLSPKLKQSVQLIDGAGSLSESTRVILYALSFIKVRKKFHDLLPS
jgi:hypothetical protein